MKYRTRVRLLNLAIFIVAISVGLLIAFVASMLLQP